MVIAKVFQNFLKELENQYIEIFDKVKSFPK